MVQLTLRITAAHGRAHHLVEALHPHVRQALRTSGCRAAHLAADVEAADVYWYCEEWEDPRALERRVRAPEFSEFLALMETSTEPPLLEFRVIEKTRGLDYVERLRESTAGAPEGAL
jgi:quinol monooxygenase YgiN